jgi:hypothetical protein
MSTPETPRPGGSHRAAGPPEAAGAGTPLLLPVLSALVVLGAIGLAAWMLLTSGDDAQQTDNPPQVTQPTADATTPEPTATGDGDGDDDGDKNGGGDGDKNGGDGNGNGGDGDKNGPDGDGDGDKNGGGDGDKNGGGGGDGDKNNGPNSTGPVPQVPVYVFNQTPITGLAAETGANLEASGWNIVGVDNWVGTVPEDTVYFYPGDRAAAERLSRDFPDIARVWPASAPMPEGALTVILADTERK